MNPDEIADFLLQHPAFFEDYPELLTRLKLPHPQGAHLISLHERQLISLREQHQKLEKKLHDWVDFAKENDTLQQKVHDFVVALFAARNTHDIVSMTPHLIQHIFNIKHVAFQIWPVNPPSNEIRDFCNHHSTPVCQQQSLADTAAWFSDQTTVFQSYAYLPLHAGIDSIGLLILASEDKNHYTPKMDTLVLHRLSEVIAAALHPHLHHGA